MTYKTGEDNNASLTTVILTLNESRHIARAMASVAAFSDRVLVVDSGSTDDTVAIARELGAEVLHNPWKNYATQMNWALDHLPAGTDWVLRLDADEIVTPELAEEIICKCPLLGSNVHGVYVSRRMHFMGQPVRWGGVFPICVLRLFRNGQGRCENRWMDEHITVVGDTKDFHSEIIDNNLNSLTWWTEKHNSYASREVVDLLNLEFCFMTTETIANLRKGKQAGVKRWLKEHAYARLPTGMRALIYFIYRYVFRLGFLDGREGTAFHVLQGFWYRYLVDMKLHEVKMHMQRTDDGVETAIRDVLGIDVTPSKAGRE